ncbi:MAG: hypothetical protein AAGF46_00690 [Pseudomonadota bacterium]
MKYIFSLLFGFLVGALGAILTLLFLPFSGEPPRTQLSQPDFSLAVSGDAAVTVVSSAAGMPWLSTEPARAVPAAVDGVRSAARVSLAPLADVDQVAYVVRLSSMNNEGKPVFGSLYEQNLWHVIVPGRGGLIVSSQENVWGFARELALPLLRGETWRGDIRYRTTAGPVAGFGRVMGISGEFTDLRGRADLSQGLTRASVAEGLSGTDGVLSVQLDAPEPAVAQTFPGEEEATSVDDL